MSAQLIPPIKSNGHASRIRQAGFMETQALGSLDELGAQLRAERGGKRGENHGARLGELLLHHSMVTPIELKEALEGARIKRRRLGDELVARGLVGSEVLRLVLAEQFGYPVVDLKRIP